MMKTSMVLACNECRRRKKKCNRGQPCSSCKFRGTDCAYRQEEPPTPGHQADNISTNPQGASVASLNGSPLCTSSSLAYIQISHSTTGILQEIEAHTHTDGCQSRLTTGAPDQDFSAISDQYRVLIRQLPSKDHIDLLFDIYMREYNWQHYVVDPDIFSSQLEAWINLSFKDGPESLSPDLRVFPAVLFQVIATALLLLPKESHPILDSLKYAKDLAFEDLASEYSEAGSTIVNILGRKAITIDTVVAQSLRASFMKLTGNVIEYWHMIGVAIRHAQELGMHHDSLDPKPRNLSVKSMLENQWLIERRRRLYMSLVICDTYMSVILGRPGAIDWKQGLPSVPLDAPVPLSRSQTTPIPRNDAINPPTPITWTLLIYKLADPLREIRGLDQDGSTQDFSRVDSIQQKLFNLKTPESAIFRLENPDTRWDLNEETKWIQTGRALLAMLHSFCLMALHRIFIFHRRESRFEALKAGLELLRIQKLTFDGLPVESWTNSLLFFGTFDAVVLIALVHLLFPHEHQELVASSLQHFHWTIERFSAIQDSNPLAKSAQGVLRSLLRKIATANTDVSTHETAPTNEKDYWSELEAQGEEPDHSGTDYTEIPPSTSVEHSNTNGLGMIGPAHPLYTLVCNAT